MGKISIEKMEFYAYHGHYEEEQVIGNRFLVDIHLEADCSEPAETDNLKDAVDYQKVYLLIKLEMGKKSHLLEHICKRILNAIFEEFETIDSAQVKVRKMNPAMGGRMDNVSVTLEMEREFLTDEFINSLSEEE